MPRYRPAACARKEKNASQTCICTRVVAGSCLKTSPILDHGPIDTCNLEVQTSTLQSIHCGLPASWTRASDIPLLPSPVASRGGGRGLLSSIGLRSNSTSRRHGAKLPVWEFTRRLVQGPTSLPTAVRTPHPAQKAWSGPPAVRFASAARCP